MTSHYQLDNDFELDLNDNGELDLEDYVPDSEYQEDISDILDSIQPPTELRQEASGSTRLELQNSPNFPPHDPPEWDDVVDEDLAEDLARDLARDYAEARFKLRHEASEKLRQEAVVNAESKRLPQTHVVIDVLPIGKSPEDEANAGHVILQQEFDAIVEENLRLQEDGRNMQSDRLRNEINLQADLSILYRVYIIISIIFFLVGFILILSNANSGDREIIYMGLISWACSIIIICCIPVLRNIFTYF